MTLTLPMELDLNTCTPAQIERFAQLLGSDLWVPGTIIRWDAATEEPHACQQAIDTMEE